LAAPAAAATGSIAGQRIVRVDAVTEALTSYVPHPPVAAVICVRAVVADLGEEHEGAGRGQSIP
jgi:hypothetical protein